MNIGYELSGDLLREHNYAHTQTHTRTHTHDENMMNLAS